MPEKRKSKSKGHSHHKLKRNNMIRSEFFAMQRNGYRVEKILKILANKYFLSKRTIENIVYRNS